MHLGIDFGTCFTSAAILTGNQFRFVRDQSGGNASFAYPSVVYLTPEGELLIGTIAKNTARRDPTRFREEFKRLLGSDTPCLLGDQSFKPEELVTRLIAHLKAEAESTLETGLNSVVLTVPASYDSYRRDLMRKAAIDAGFPEEGVTLIDEPEAAARYYDWQIQQQGYAIKEGATILVYDLGGGTFDAALMRKEGDSFRSITAPVGEAHCGGVDFDRVIFQEILAVASDELKDLLSQENNSVQALRMRLMMADYCRDVKHQLSTRPEYDDVLPVASGEEFLLKQAAFAAKIAPYIEGTINLCKELIARSGCRWEDVTGILMIGGSSRIPSVKSQLAAAFGRPLWQVEDPQLAVAMGAAILTTSQSQIQQISLEPKFVEKQILASGCADTTIRLWDASNGNLLHILSSHEGGVTAVAFSPDGKLLASASRDNTVKIWNPITGVLNRTIPAHSNQVNTVVFSPDGTLLASGSADSTIKIWDTTTNKLIRTISGFGHGIMSIAFCPDSKVLASGNTDSNINLWNPNTGDLIRDLSVNHNKSQGKFITSLSFSPDGNFLVSGAVTPGDEDTLEIWDIKKNKVIRTFPSYLGVCISPSGQLVASGCPDKTINIWNISNGELEESLIGHSERNNDSLGIFERISAGGFIQCLTFSFDEKRLFSGSNDKSVKIWDIQNGELLHTLFGHQDSIDAITFTSMKLEIA